ncbi:MAG: hypothetical protein ABI345_01685 [Jatrophihabitans sp.]
MALLERARTVADAMISTARVHGPEATVGQVRAAFDDDHIHAVVILSGDVLAAVIERADLSVVTSDARPAAAFGTLRDRTVAPDVELEQTRQHMLRTGRRRLAVVGSDRTYRGLLCLKRDGTGFCSDADVLARAAERVQRRRCSAP